MSQFLICNHSYAKSEMLDLKTINVKNYMISLSKRLVQKHQMSYYVWAM